MIWNRRSQREEAVRVGVEVTRRGSVEWKLETNPGRAALLRRIGKAEPQLGPTSSSAPKLL